MSAILEVNDVRKSFGGIRALDGCTFDVEEGSITGLIGPNGSGKTSLFNAVTGFIQPDSGSVTLQGQSIMGLAPDQVFDRGIGRTFQQVRIFRRLSVFENVLVANRSTSWRDAFARTRRPDEHERAMDVLRFLDIAKLKDVRAETLSFGQKKLLEFATILIARPKLLLLDEPAGGINPTMTKHIEERILRLNQQGITILVVEHNMEFVMGLSHHIVVMARGSVIARGKPAEVRSNPQVLEAYLGQ